MKKLLFKRKTKFILYLIACFFPIIADLLRIGTFGLITQAMQVAEMDFFIKTAIVGVLFIPLSFILQLSSRMLRIKYMRDTIFDVRMAAFDKIMNSSYRQFSKKSKEVYISNLVNDINIFERDFFINLLNFIYRGGIYSVSLVVVLIIDWKLGLILFSVSLILFFLARAASKKTINLQKKVSVKNEEMTTDVANVFNGLEIIKLNNIEDRFLHKTNNSVDKVETGKFKFRFFAESQRNITSILGLATILGLLLYLMIQMQKGIEYGILMILVMLSNNIAFSLPDVFPRLNVIKSSAGIYNKITMPEEENTGNNKHETFRFDHEIRVDNLSFSLEKKPIFKNISFTIEKGKKYLIKGPSGIGKSTLIKLLAMIYDNYQGQISIDGIDYRTINEKSLNNAIAFVYQDVFLFEDTVKNNIALYKDLDDKSLNDAIEKAGLTEFINNLDTGTETLITENGKNLSGGERQRISIARAIAKNAAVVFIDEGTSALNEELGREIEKSFLALDSTVIAVSHRYYSGVTEKYDYVLELKGGGINVYKADTYFAQEVQYA